MHLSAMLIVFVQGIFFFIYELCELIFRTFFLDVTLLIFLIFEFVIIAISHLGYQFFMVDDVASILIIIIRDTDSVACSSFNYITFYLRYKSSVSSWHIKVDKIWISTIRHRFYVWWSTPDLFYLLKMFINNFSTPTTCPTNNIFWKLLANFFDFLQYTLIIFGYELCILLYTISLLLC